MFWGLIVEPKKRYTQTVEKAFHLSMASLDAATSGDNLVQVMLVYENRNYLLCSLQKDSLWQAPLDLNFEEGSKISFMTNGEGHVHLTGYLIPENEIEDELDYDEEESDDENEEEPQLVENKKRKADSLFAKFQNKMKKIKNEQSVEEEEDEDSDSEDEDFLEGEEDVDDDESQEEMDMDDESEDEDEEDEEDEDEVDDDEEEEKVQPKEVVNKSQNQKKNKQKQMNGHSNLENQNKQLNGSATKETEKKQKKNKEGKPQDKPKNQQQQQQKTRTVEGGLQISDIQVGNGPVAKTGRMVTVYYVGRLKNGKKFDQTKSGEGFKFRLGKNEVIKGWDIGLAGMKVGGKRRLTIPPAMAYGSKGSGGVIPPNSTLTFEIELKAVN